MVSTVPTFYTSASKIKAWFACPRRAKLEKFVETAAMRDGTARHALVELHYKGQLHPNIINILRQVIPREPVDDVIRCIDRPGMFPDGDQVISMEGENLPPHYATVMYGRKLFQVPGGVYKDLHWGLRGAADLVCVQDDNPDVLLILDWKGRTQDDGEIQGSCYALAYSLMFPGFKTYRFEQRSLTGSWPHDPYDFLFDEMEKVREFIGELVYRMKQDTTAEPRENKWCYSCSVNGDCPVYLKAANAPLVESLPVAKTYQLPADFGALLELKEKAANHAKIAETIKERCQEALLAELDVAPVRSGGHTYSKGTGTSSYSIVDEDLIVKAWHEAGREEQDLATFLDYDVPSLRGELQKMAKSIVDEPKRLKVVEALEKAFTPNTYPKIVKKAGG